MKVKWLFFLLWFPLTLTAFSVADHLCVLHEGRYMPFGALDGQGIEECLLLPLAHEPWEHEAGSWISLQDLRPSDQLAYPEALATKIWSAYKNNQMQEVVLLLRQGYSLIEKSVYKRTSTKSFTYPSQKKLDFELYFNKLPLTWVIMGFYLLSLLFFKRVKWAQALFIGAFAVHTLVLGLRIYLLGRPPVSNMSETLLYVPWVCSLLGVLFIKKRVVWASAALVAIVLLLFLPAQSALATVPAVLNSQLWLTVHVLMVVGSYGFFFLAGVLAHIYLIQNKKNHGLIKTMFQISYLGVIFLIGGTLLGGVWAAQSWGRFWDWDPKEAWAFISSGFYLFLIHGYQFKKIKERGFAIGLIIGLMAITFTWYGVNYILATGLHSYGFGNGGEKWYLAYLVLEVLFLLYIKKKIAKKEH